MNQRVTQILAQNPAWNGVEIVVTPLIGGITKQNYRLDSGEEARAPTIATILCLTPL